MTTPQKLQEAIERTRELRSKRHQEADKQIRAIKDRLTHLYSNMTVGLHGIDGADWTTKPTQIEVDLPTGKGTVLEVDKLVVSILGSQLTVTPVNHFRPDAPILVVSSPVGEARVEVASNHFFVWPKDDDQKLMDGSDFTPWFYSQYIRLLE